MTMNLNRRIFLRGLGGAVVAAPFLSSVAERAAKAQGAPPPGDPRRLIAMFTHYGCFTKDWFPEKSHGPLTAADFQGKTTEAIGAHAAKLLVPRGIRAMNEWSFSGELGQTTDPHTQTVGSFFTCQPVTPDDGKFTATPTGKSLDHVIAEQLSSDGAPLFLRVGNRSDSPQSAVSYSAAGTAFAGIGTPSQVFNQLTKLYGQTGPTTPDTYKVAAGKSVLDIVRDDLSSLELVPMSTSDKKKLSDWKDLLTDVATGVRAECSEASANKLELTANSGTGGDITAGAATAMNSVAVLAALCDYNRVIFIKYPGSYIFTGLGLNKDAHGLSHRQGDAYMGGRPCVAGVNDMLKKIDTWYVEQFADLVAKLDSFSEGTGTVLDNSAAVHFQEMSDGNSHNLNNLPILHAGSCGGYFKVGQAVNVEDGGASMTNGNSDAACGDGGTANVPGNVDGTGTSKDIANVPINKYFCNLMNAVGVKADASGYAAVGGTEPVTKFGKYDDTKLFKGGGAAASVINKPGEIEALRANS
jgi:hypothetical protein